MSVLEGGHATEGYVLRVDLAKHDGFKRQILTEYDRVVGKVL